MASVWSNKGKARLALAGVSGKTFKLLIVNATGAAIAAGTMADYNTVSQVTANEISNISGTGYARKTLANVTVIEDDANDRAYIDADDPSLYAAINAGVIAGGWVFENVDGTDANDLVWLFLDITDITTNGTDVSLAFSATTGLSTVT